MGKTNTSIRAEKKVVQWNGANLTKEKQFTMEGSVQTLSFNPITAQLFVGTSADIGIYNPEVEKKPLEKKAVKSAIKTSSWSPDGRLVAYASASGAVHIKDSKFNRKVYFFGLVNLKFFIGKFSEIGTGHLCMLVTFDDR